MKASVTGDDISTLRSNLVCVNVLTIDYASVTIYWIDQCEYQIQSLRLDGDEATFSYPFTTTIQFASGLVIKNNTFYWSDQSGVFERINTADAVVRTIYDLRKCWLRLLSSLGNLRIPESIIIIGICYVMCID